MSAPIIRTDETSEAIGAVEKALAELRATKANPNNWKWVIIALHNALQGFMVLTLRFTNPVLIARAPQRLRKWNDEIITAYNQRKLVRDLPENIRRQYMKRIEYLAEAGWPPDERSGYIQAASDGQVNLLALGCELITFGELFERIQNKKYAAYTPQPNEFPFQATKEQKHDVALLTQLRNEYLHFTPKSWAIYLEGSYLPRMVFNCATIMLYFVEQGEVLRSYPENEQERETTVVRHLREMQEEAQEIAAEYGMPI